ncbi:Eco57I restriction-modification methylase domain-containing protein [Thermus caliditerrae]|uniref:Eco57I restriction-modification methylase domain-containing protein n=1 Tax=Thermus caliditerrae TaxID=1330700 RepID=UPI000572095A|nr:N-6 DNA methylase [Thermus caliditerrae]
MFYALRVSGGLLTEEFLQELARPEALRELGLTQEALQDRFLTLLGLYERLKPLYGLTDIRRAREVWLLPFFRALGYEPVYNRSPLRIGDLAFPISHLAGEDEEAPPLHLVAQDLDLKPARREKSPQGLLQAFLNAHPQKDWGVLAAPWEVRLLRKYFHVSAPGYAAFNLVELFEAPRDAALREFQVLYLLLHPSRFRRGKDGETPLDRYWDRAREVGTRAKEALRKGVVQALEVLGNAFLTEELRRELEEPEKLAAYHRELLRLVYRLLFLLYAEARGLIPQKAALSWVYEREYSLTALRERALRQEPFREDRHTDLWERLLLTFRLVHEGDEDLGVPALNGELFHPQGLPLLTGGVLDPAERPRYPNLPRPSNAALLEAVRLLAFVERDGALDRINFRDLEVEELGHVYEGVLALAPRLVEGRYTLESHLLERKATGSYYTPRELVQLVLQESLAPVVEERLQKAGPDPKAQEEALLSLKVLDPAMGSGAFLISALEYLSEKLLEVRGVNPQEDPEALYEARHLVASRCLYGVDKNPMAVELAKLSLWVAAAARGKPLSFLDHHLKVGNSLVGAPEDFLARGLSREAYKREGVAKEALQGLAFGPGPGGLFLSPPPPPPLDFEEVRVEDVEAKRARYRAWRESDGVRRLEVLADYWTAAFFLEPGPGVRLPDAQGLHWLAQQEGASLEMLRQSSYLSPATLAAIEAAKARHRFFHWWLEFPEVFQKGGFDVVLGNPPWEKVKLEDKQFFADKDPAIAEAENAAKRQKLIRALEEKNPALYRAYREALREAEATSLFLRASGRFPLSARGDVNTYQVFAELARSLRSPTGRVGMVLPTGIATDDSSKEFFADLVERGELAALLDFENREALFPGVHRSYKFAVFILQGPQAGGQEAKLAFFLIRPEQAGDEVRTFSLSPEDFRLLNPNTRTCPVFRTRQDAELTKAIYRRVPVLWRESPEENPWGVRFLRMLDMANDSALFREREALEGQGFTLAGNRFVRGEEVYLPLYEAKMVWHYDHRFATYEGEGTRDLAPEEHQDPTRLPLPRYWVRREEVEERLVKRDRNGGEVWRWGRGWLLGWRDIARSTDERTFISTVYSRSAAGDTFLQMFPDKPTSLVLALLGSLDSLVFDYVTRQKISGTHLKYHVVKQLPVLPPGRYTHADLLFLVPRILELTYTAWDLAPLAQDVWQEADEALREALLAQHRGSGGHPDASPPWAEGPYPFPPFRWDEERRALLRAELDAYYAHLYGLNRKQLRYILDPQDLTPKELADILSDWEEVENPLDPQAYRRRREASAFPGETFRVLKEKEEKRFGEYRTRRLVLEAWARLFGSKA